MLHPVASAEKLFVLQGTEEAGDRDLFRDKSILMKLCNCPQAFVRYIRKVCSVCVHFAT